MIALREDRNEKDITIKQMAMLDCKENILVAFDILGIKVSKSHRKHELAECLESIFKDNSVAFVNALPREEYKMFTKLMAMDATEYITYPINLQKFLVMQKLYLVVSYQGVDGWHLYIPQSIRNQVNKDAERQAEEVPGMREFQGTMEKLISCKDRLTAVLEDKTKTGKQKIAEIISAKRETEKYQRKLRAQEAQLKAANVDTARLHKSIAEFLTFCDMFIAVGRLGGKEFMS